MTAPSKELILSMLDRWIRQRPGLEFGNYGDVSAYRSELRSITKDLNHARKLLRAVELSSITAEQLMAAFPRAFSGRLRLRCTRKWECACGHKWRADVEMAPTANLSGEATQWCPKCNVRPLIGSPHQWALDYCTGQYWPTEYRKAACAVLASALWDHKREHCMPAPLTQEPRTYLFHGNGKSPDAVSAGDWLRASFRRDFGRGIANRWFN